MGLGESGAGRPGDDLKVGIPDDSQAAGVPRGPNSCCQAAGKVLTIEFPFDVPEITHKQLR